MAAFTQFDGNGFMKVGTRDVEKALGDALVNAIQRSEDIREGLISTVTSAQAALQAYVGSYLSTVFGGKLSLVEPNETADGTGLHAHRGLYYTVADWPAGLALGLPVTIGPVDGASLVPATWDSAAYLGLTDWATPTTPRKGRVITAGTVLLTATDFSAYSPGETVYVGDGAVAAFAKKDDVPTGKYLIPVGVYLGQDKYFGQGVLRMVSAPATLKTA